MKQTTHLILRQGLPYVCVGQFSGVHSVFSTPLVDRSQRVFWDSRELLCLDPLQKVREVPSALVRVADDVWKRMKVPQGSNATELRVLQNPTVRTNSSVVFFVILSAPTVLANGEGGFGSENLYLFIGQIFCQFCHDLLCAFDVHALE